MITKRLIPEKHGHRFSWWQLLWLAVGVLILSSEVFAAKYQITLQQRRMGDQIGVEFWVKDVTGNGTAPNMGNATLNVLYNPTFLAPAALVNTLGSALRNPTPFTDSIDVDVNIANPYASISSDFVTAPLGYGDLMAHAVHSDSAGAVVIDAFGLSVVHNPNTTGFKPSSVGRGSFVGLMKFDIINKAALSDLDLTGIMFNHHTFAGALTLQDANGNDILADAEFVNPDAFTVRGIKILNPNGPNQAVNRYPDPAYLALSPNKGYPVYFERSGLIEDPTTTPYGTNSVAYLLEYSLNNGSSWNEFGRVAETNLGAVALGLTKDRYRSGEIDSIDGINDLFVTQANGVALPAVVGDGYNGIIRTIWKASENFQYRSEEAKIQITQVVTSGTTGSLTLRNKFAGATRTDMSDFNFVLGRLFFVQLNGTNGYFRTKNNYSNATQLTVEAWVNLNSVQSLPGAEPGIVVSSSGSASPEEGSWMLYLKDGKYPAFRAREIDGKGPDGYLGSVVAPAVDTLSTTSDAKPIQDGHARNWTHIAATVQNNIVTLYVNGEKVAEYVNKYSVSPRMQQSMQPIWIGVNPNTGIKAQNYLHSGIKEVRVWRVALPQDVLKSYIGGVYDPNGSITALAPASGDKRTALELDYIFQGTRLDIANNQEYQYNANPLNYYIDSSLGAVAQNSAINYRPDRSHIKLTSPTGGEGISNLKSKVFEVRWAAYGLGKISPGSKDLQLMVSRDNGSSWFDAIDNQSPTSYALDQVEIEAGKAYWEPFNNITLSGHLDDLQGVVDVDNNWSKSVRMKISGTELRGQDNIYDVSKAFTVAPYFGLENLGDNNSQIFVEGSTDLNLSGSAGFIEAWIKPYRFPTQSEGFFPIVAKKSANGDSLHYSLRLLPTGQLQFIVLSTTGEMLRTATSDAALPIIKPNVLIFDSVWCHVGVYVNLGSKQSSVYFYIDGNVQSADLISTQLGEDVKIDKFNTYPTYIASEPISQTENRNFIGQIKEVRFWGGTPGNQTITSSGSNPSDMTKFIQGALTVRADELTSVGGVNYAQNLLAAFVMNGGTFVNNGFVRSIPAYPTSGGLVAHITGTTSGQVNYRASKPFIKLVEPVYKQKVPNTKTDLRVRWVGFDFNRNDITTFRNGGDATNNADLEFGTLGGGGNDVIHYQYVASQKYSPSYINAMQLVNVDPLYEFPGTLTKSQYALKLNASKTDPDFNKNQVYGEPSDQNVIGATKKNGRFQLRGRSIINGKLLEYDNNNDGMVTSLITESPLFDITPPSNFTLRVLLEGFHEASNATAPIIRNLGGTFENKGLKIKLLTNNANQPGIVVDSAESTEGYANTTTAMDIANRGTGTNNFANVPFVFTELNDGRYFVIVDHINHLPIMSAYAAKFQYAGDEQTTWAIESGWDFQNWDGTNTQVTDADASATPPTIAGKYTAHGYSVTDENSPLWASTGMNFNNGRLTGNSMPLAGMVGGDVVKDGKIDGYDRSRVRLDAGSNTNRADVTGDGFVNNFDRDIVDRNNNKTSSLNDLNIKYSAEKDNSGAALAMIPQAKAIMDRFTATQDKYLANGGEKIHQGKDKAEVMAGGFRYKVYGYTKKNGEFIDVSMYIQNEGTEYALGNCTFGVSFDQVNLEFDQMMNTDDVIFSNRDELGYGPTYSAPTNDTRDPINNVRTIEIDYDRYTQPLGQNVPNTKTYLGTIRFRVKNEVDLYHFEWHKISGVLTTKGQDVTGDGIFEPIDDIFVNRAIAITIPNGGEKWRSNQLYTISWTKPSIDKAVFVNFSTDNGATWTRIPSTAVNLTSQEFNWKTPRVSSTQCIVALVDAETGAIVDRSDAPFAIVPATAEITKPSAKDAIYKGGLNDDIKWLVEDKSNIRFEFSADGETGWMPVTASINSDDGSIKWQLPAVNTKKAVIRMMNNETGDVMAISDQFKILSGALTLANVSPDNEVNIGEKRNVRWTYDNVSLFDLQFSPDGSSWETVARDLTALQGSFEWLVPKVNATNALLRAIWNNDNDLEYSRTAEFKILGAIGVKDGDNQSFMFDKMVPNPFTTKSNIVFTLPFEEKVTITVYNSTGLQVRTIVDGKTFSAGTHSLTLESYDLSAGVYYVHLNAGIFSMAREVVLIK